MLNIMQLSDSYKATHWKQYPLGTEAVYSYFESRGGEFTETTFFGLQYFLSEYLEHSAVVRRLQGTYSGVELMADFWRKHLGGDHFNQFGWEHIRDDHSWNLPVSIKAVPEGTTVPNRNVLMTIENTCPKCYWLTNWLETLLVQEWYPCTVTTLSRHCKKILLHSLERSGTPEDVYFKLHDFGFRGVSSPESAMLGGAAHLVNFKGTDTIAGIFMADSIYGARIASDPISGESGIAGFSIPAAEHSTVCSWGRENELQAFANMLDQFPTGLVSVVSDSYDIFNACRQYWGTDLKDRILERNGTLVVRPDSGDPAPTVIKVLEILGEKFGTVKNAKGYNELPPQIRIIQGDGVDPNMIDEILVNMELRDWSANNIAFGMGGALLQKLNRDTQKFAFKCSAVKINGEWQDVYKQPVTDSMKVSKAGRMKLVMGHKTQSLESDGQDSLVEVFRNGRILGGGQTFSQIRERANVDGY